MFMSDWSALMNPRTEGHPGQHAYTFVIRILSTSLTSVSIFSVSRYSWYLSRWPNHRTAKKLKSVYGSTLSGLARFLPGRKYGQPCGAWPPPPQSTEQNEELMATTSLLQGINSS
jgi:hypothetical protein